MRLDEFDYVLPDDRIAHVPAEPRDSSRLMVLERSSGRLMDRRFYELPGLLEPGDLLVFNESRVIKARLLGRRPGGGSVEALLLRPIDAAAEVWEALVRPARRIREGTSLRFAGGEGPAGESGLAATLLRHLGEGRAELRLDWRGRWPDVLEKVGRVPLPPYIRADGVPDDRYQTVYARAPGSSAAPTAGLHFTPELLAALQEAGIAAAFITLHVGLGTFRPVQTERIEEHRMHSEYFEVPEQAARAVRAARASGRRVVAVGTTVTRTLETVAGTILGRGGGPEEPLRGWTDLFIGPGYRFRLVDALITNFHLPRSTLLMLVSAFAGRERVLAAYAEAVAKEYRFYSFGDAMLIL